MVLGSGFEPLLSDPQSDVLTANTNLEGSISFDPLSHDTHRIFHVPIQ